MDAAIFSGLPTGLANELISSYREIARNYFERRWEPSELNGGKFCEIVYTILDGATSGTFHTTAKKPSNMLDACRLLETRPANTARVGDRSLRILLPRLLPFVYEIRNNRGVGHVGGDVNPNHEDAEAVLSAATWAMAELVRIFHGVTLAEAQVLVESLVQKKHPLVWSVGEVKRVLSPSMKTTDQVLVLLYSETGWVASKTLSAWVEYSSPTMFKTRALDPLHHSRLIEHDAKNGKACITPLGMKAVEERLLPIS